MSDSFLPGVTYGINAGTIEIFWAGMLDRDDFTAVFDVTADAVPEPATGALILLGVGLTGAMRRRRVRPTATTSGR